MHWNRIRDRLAVRLVGGFAALAIACASARAQSATEPPISEPLPIVEEPAAGGTPPAAVRFETDLEFNDLVAEQRYTEALAIADTLIARTAEEFGESSLETAGVYARVGAAQFGAGEHDRAARSYVRSVDLYRAIEGPYTPLVIEPLTGLGDAYHASAEYLEAVSAYTEARTVSRRAYGLLTEKQIPLLDRLTLSLVSLNQPIEADQQQIEALRLVERNYPPQSPDALGAIYKYAGWLRDSGRFQEEREQYSRALRIIREHFGKAAPEQAPALVGIGNSFRIQRIPDSQGVGALREALGLLLAESDPNELAIAEVLRDLGDWEVAFSKAGYDGAEYRRAWQLLGSVPDGDRLRDAWFNGPVYVLREPISQRGLSFAEDAIDGHVLVRFDLDALGRTENVAVVESKPPGFKDESVVRHVRRSRFRPQLENGGLVPAQALVLQFTFRYTPDGLAEAAQSRND